MSEGLNFENEYYFPPEIWKDETVFIIGGGPSLKGMEWKNLYGKRVIGCNDAYQLGFKPAYKSPYLESCFPLRPTSSWIQIILFGDNCWFAEHRDHIVKREEHHLFISMASQNPHCESVSWMRREPEGLTTRDSGKIGWNKSTGAGAINLALILGAKRIVLLGFDMKMGKDHQANWHSNEVNQPIPSDYIKFSTGMELIAMQLSDKYPNIEILNAGPDSALDCFEKVNLEEIL